MKSLITGSLRKLLEIRASVFGVEEWRAKFSVVVLTT